MAAANHAAASPPFPATCSSGEVPPALPSRCHSNQVFLSCRALKLNHASICDKLPQTTSNSTSYSTCSQPNYRRRSTLTQQTAAPTWGGEAALHSISRQRSGSSAGDHSSLPLNESAGPTNACYPSLRRPVSPARQHPRGCCRLYRLHCQSMMP